jgi:hypothetical protein
VLGCSGHRQSQAPKRTSTRGGKGTRLKRRESTMYVRFHSTRSNNTRSPWLAALSPTTNASSIRSFESGPWLGMSSIGDYSHNVHPVPFEQKQNLNEVENLYFHHAHQRGTKPYSLPLVATTQNDLPSSVHSGTTRKSSPSQHFKAGSSTLSGSHTIPKFSSSDREGATDSTYHVGRFLHSPSSELPQPCYSAENGVSYPAPSRSLTSVDVDSESKRPLTLSRTLSFPRAGSPHLNPHPGHQYVMTGTTGGFSSASLPGHSSTNYHSNIMAGQPSPRHEPYSLAPASSSSSSTLTYDSFWSSRSFRGSIGSGLSNAVGFEESSPHTADLDVIGLTGSNGSGTSQAGGHEVKGTNEPLRRERNGTMGTEE